MPKGFTLIELLIVIAIIGIMAGTTIMIIDPASHQRKAKEAVLLSNIEKSCLALYSCAIGASDAYRCDTKAEIGLKDITGNPEGASYYLNTDLDVDSDVEANSPDAKVYYKGVLPNCTIYCSFDFEGSSSDNITKIGCVN